MAQLARHVHVHHQGGSTVFGPDDEVPDWAAKLITAPNAWAEESKSSQASSQAETPTPKQTEDPPKRSSGRPSSKAEQ